MKASRFFLFLACFMVLAAVSSPAQTLTCSSNDMGRHFCRANTANGVQMVRQRSGSPCTQGYSWGYDNGGVWVDHGCRADFAFNGGGAPGYGSSPIDAQRMCKNTAGERMPNIPLAYISVYRGTDTGDGNYMINFRAQPPNSRVSSGFCIIAKSGQLLRFQFDPGAGPNQGGYGQGGYGQGQGGYGGGMTPQTAMQSCKSQVSAWAPRVPLAYILINQANRVGGGGYMVPFQTRPPGMPGSNGFCNVSQSGQVDVWSGGRKVR